MEFKLLKEKQFVFRVFREYIDSMDDYSEIYYIDDTTENRKDIESIYTFENKGEYSDETILLEHLCMIENDGYKYLHIGKVFYTEKGWEVLL